MRGYRVHYVPGWDCHGLPIELKALQAQRAYPWVALLLIGTRRLARAGHARHMLTVYMRVLLGARVHISVCVVLCVLSPVPRTRCIATAGRPFRFAVNSFLGAACAEERSRRQAPARAACHDHRGESAPKLRAARGAPARLACVRVLPCAAICVRACAFCVRVDVRACVRAHQCLLLLTPSPLAPRPLYSHVFCAPPNADDRTASRCSFFRRNPELQCSPHALFVFRSGGSRRSLRQRRSRDSV